MWSLASMCRCASAASSSRYNLVDQRLHLSPRRAAARPWPSRGAGYGGLLGDGARPHGRPRMDQALDHQGGEVHLGLGAAQEGDLHDAAPVGGGLVVALHIGPRPTISRMTSTPAAARRLFGGGGDEILGLVVDGPVGAEAEHRLAFAGRSGGGEDARPERLAELDGGSCRSPTSRRGSAASRPVAAGRARRH